MSPSDWLARQHQFAAERDAARAQCCECGHTAHKHFESHAFCQSKDCRCGSFQRKEAA